MLGQPRILIVGAGPTGLMLANTLSHFNVAFDIIDAKDGFSSNSKGLSLNMACQAMLAMLGIRDRVGCSAYRIRKLSLLVNRKRVASCDFGRLPGNRHLLVQPQSRTEEELGACLAERKVAIGWGQSLVDLRRSGDRYDALTEDTSTGSITTRSYDYVIGCEGKNSVTREAIGANFVGQDYPLYFVLGDFQLENDVLDAEAQYLKFGNDFFIMVPLGNRNYRLVTVATEKKDSGEIYELISGIVNAYFGDDLVRVRPSWTSSSRIYLRVSDKLRDGGLFICGDSCHLVSPLGGTGMNMGMQDAFSLGCKLAGVLTGRQGKDMLDLYETERLQVINLTCEMVDWTTRILSEPETHDGPLAMLVPKMSNRSMFRRVLPYTYSGLGARYTAKVVSGLDRSFEAEYFGRLYPGIEGLYSSFAIGKIKPVLIINLAGEGLLDQEAVESAENLVRLVREQYGDMIGVVCLGSGALTLEGESLLSSDLSVFTPGKSVFLVNMEGFIEYGCRLRSAGSMVEHLSCSYLSRS